MNNCNDNNTDFVLTQYVVLQYNSITGYIYKVISVYTITDISLEIIHFRHDAYIIFNRMYFIRSFVNAG